ncbi:dipeptide transport ATP-binding protein DppD [Lentibacillus populi]|uniref:Dipeptide transport ATP-binding protein DppD n=2 Tax=Lentibacillus populi TaxID=1827502 RepID=A0A9W5X4Y0_9BACI|nr:dipeptide transport ATP-binding protein DppD [Lentibacillus populi]
MEGLLQVKNLEVQFKTGKKRLKAVRDISFSVKRGETLCIVGESGSGKSITSLSILGLLPTNGEITKGSIRLSKQELVGLPEKEFQKIRGNEISMIFQEPMTALNPTFTIGFQLREPLMIHRKLSEETANKECISLLKRVGIPDPAKKLKQFPHELSGGMLQRVMIAIALACEPNLLLADEPTTALDVTIQAQILDLIDDLKKQMGMGVVFVTHDMGVVAEIADQVMVIYAGEIAEIGDVDSIFNNPQHPYTKGLLGAVPNVDEKEHELNIIPGSMPNLDDQISGCRFHPRCPYAMDVCRKKSPPAFRVSDGRQSKCWLQEVNVNESATTIT